MKNKQKKTHLSCLIRCLILKPTSARHPKRHFYVKNCAGQQRDLFQNDGSSLDEKARKKQVPR
jgi:hypothetical protein